jgi:hypothetical protein
MYNGRTTEIELNPYGKWIKPKKLVEIHHGIDYLIVFAFFDNEENNIPFWNRAKFIYNQYGDGLAIGTPIKITYPEGESLEFFLSLKDIHQISKLDTPIGFYLCFGNYESAFLPIRIADEMLSNDYLANRIAVRLNRLEKQNDI